MNDINKNIQTSRAEKHIHTHAMDDNYRREWADKESNPTTAVWFFFFRETFQWMCAGEWYRKHVYSL